MSVRTFTGYLAWLTAGGLLAAAGGAQAAAGQVLFSLGQVDITRSNALISAQRGTPIEVADRVVVGPAARAQLRMNDGALIALQPGSTLVIEDYYLAPSDQGGASRSFFKLLKGGLRTITGLISKRVGDSYKVTTPVATIGVRGTDYRIAWCQKAGNSASDCGDTPDGLYLGVSDGGIVVANEAGALDLLNDEYAYVSNGSTLPQKLLVPPAILETVLNDKGKGEKEGGAEAAAEGGSPAEWTDCHCTLSEISPGYRDPNVPGKLVEPTGQIAVAHSTSAPQVGGVMAGVATEGAPPLNLNQQGALTAFRGLTGSGAQDFQLGQAHNVDVGFDPNSGMRWGRWNGTAQIGGAPADLSEHNLHWVTSALPDAATAIPLSGSASYQLVGNTNPTDNQGHVGFLGSAQLSADFTNQTVTNALSLGINNQVWSATGTASLNGPSPVFGGNYSSVTVNGAAQVQGSGQFAGFFTAPAAGQSIPAGAGLTYSLTNAGVTVSGAAAFGLAP